jgi:hypothetical protein
MARIKISMNRVLNYLFFITIFSLSNNHFAHAEDSKSIIDAASKLLLGKSPANNANLVLTSADKKIQMTVSSEWSERSSDNDAAEFSALHKASGAYFLVISEGKEDFKDLASYTKIVSDQMKEAVESATVSAAEKTSINNQQAVNQKAMKFELKGFYTGMKVAYLVYTIETKTRFNQVVCWNFQSKFEASKPHFEKVAQGLTEL